MATVVVSVVAVVLESVVVVVGVAVLAGAGSEVVVAVAVTCRISAAGSAGWDRGIVSVSCSSSEAHNFTIAFRAHSGNSPDRVCAQFSSMRASCASIFSTVFIFLPSVQMWQGLYM